MEIGISGIGTALPPHQIEQAFAGEASVAYCCEEPSQARSIAALYRVSGVQNRHLVFLDKSDGPASERQQFYRPRSGDCPSGPTTGERLAFFEKAASPLALTAARGALERSGVEANAVTHLITVTCSGFSAPGFDYALIDNLPLRATVARTQIGFMGCHAALNAIRVARAFVAADPKAVVLICCVELCSLHYQYGWDREQIVANSLFADGAAACVVQHSDSTSSLARPPLQVVSSQSIVVPDSRDAMTWRVGDHGFRMTLSSRVPSLLAEHLHPWLTRWLVDFGYSPETIGTWAVHPGGPRILQGFAEAMKLEMKRLEVSSEVLRRHGNMSSPTLLFILQRLHAADAPRPYLAIGFGPGLAAEAALLV